MEKLTTIEAWTLARAVQNYPMTTPKNLVSHGVLDLVRQLQGIQIYQNKMTILMTKLSTEAFQQVDNADIEAVMPGIMTRVNRAWRIVPVGELANMPKSRWLIPDILPENGFSVLFGAPGSFKSFTALDWSLQVAQHRPVIYSIYEGMSGYWQRTLAWCLHHQMKHDNLYMVLGNLAVMDINHLGDFISTVQPVKPALVVIDTLARAMTGFDENSTRDMNSFVESIERIRQEVGTAVLVVHHTNKGGVQERGSGALRGAADMVIKQTLDDDLIVMECEKVKDSEAFETRYYQPIKKTVYIDGDPLEVPVLLPADRVFRDTERVTPSQRKIMDVLTLEVFPNGASVIEINETLPEMSRGSIYRALSRLLKGGYVVKSGKGKPYKLTDEGRRKLSPDDSMTPMTPMTPSTPTPSNGRSHESHGVNGKAKQKVLFPQDLKDYGHYDFE
jgi:hypothetical protein